MLINSQYPFQMGVTDVSTWQIKNLSPDLKTAKGIWTWSTAFTSSLLFPVLIGYRL